MSDESAQPAESAEAASAATPDPKFANVSQWLGDILHLDASTDPINNLIRSMSTDITFAKLLLDIDFGFAFFAKIKQFIRRTFIRTLFSGVEGIVHCMKQYALERENATPGIFDFKELAMLHEISIELYKGKIEDKDKYPRLQDNIRFTLHAFAKLKHTATVHPLDFGCKGWEDFTKAIDYRHRITHPKKDETTDISDEELKIAINASEWLSKTIINNVLSMMNPEDQDVGPL